MSRPSRSAVVAAVVVGRAAKPEATAGAVDAAVVAAA